MKKTLLVIALASSVGAVNAEDMTSGTFTMYDGVGGLVNTDTAVTGSIGDGAWAVSSTNTFFGGLWTAHGGTTFGPGTYTFDTIQGGVYTGIVVGAGQVGGHILFDWGPTADIDVINVWDVNCTSVTCTYTSTDITATNPVGPDGIPGIGMIDGTFINFHANFDFSTGVPPLQPLTCEDLLVLTNPDTSVDINITTDLLGTCINAQGPLTLTYTQPSNGIVTDDGTNLTYTPNQGFGGLDSFTYTADDTVLLDTSKIEVQVGGELQGNFTMLDSTGTVFGGTNDIVFTWDGTSLNIDESDTDFSLMGIKSDKPQPFHGFVWTAHHIRVYGPGAYSFDSGCTVAELEVMGCPAGSATNSGPAVSMTVGADQFGAHILFDWNTTDNIDVVNVWDQNAKWDRLGHTGDVNKLWLGAAGLPPAEDANWELVSTDVDGDGINGSPMVDGPFVDFSANFNNKPDRAGIAPDADGDGVIDDEDLCPDTQSEAAVDAVGCSDTQVDSDGDGVCNDGAVSDGPSACVGIDACPGTVIPEAVPTVRLGTNRWALVDDDLEFDTTASEGKDPGRSYSTADTGGCSCEQIIAALDLGKGHEKFGCSINAMDGWVALPR